MRRIILVGLSATVLSFGLGFGVGANIGPKQTFAVAKALSPRDRFLACSTTEEELSEAQWQALSVQWAWRYWRQFDWPAP